jgi:hypothetical protein
MGSQEHHAEARHICGLLRAISDTRGIQHLLLGCCRLQAAPRSCRLIARALARAVADASVLKEVRKLDQMVRARSHNLVVQRASPEGLTDFLGDIHATKCGLAPPKVLKAGRRHFCVAYRVLDFAVSEVSLQRPCVVPSVRQRIAAGVPEHLCILLSPS